MRIIQYKKIIIETGQIINPPWIVVGDLFNNDSNIFIGLILEESDRPYSVPDNLVYLSRQQLIDRLLPLHNQRKFSKKILIEENMVRVEFQTVEEFLDFWCQKYNVII